MTILNLIETNVLQRWCQPPLRRRRAARPRTSIRADGEYRSGPVLAVDAGWLPRTRDHLPERGRHCRIDHDNND